MALKKLCNHPGCNQLLEYGQKYCKQHTKDARQYDRYRGTAAQRGYDSRWRRARDRYLAEHPLCEECLKKGIIEPAEVVDHRIPHKGDPVLFWDESNWQALSKRCHDRKTAKEDGGFGNGRNRSI